MLINIHDSHLEKVGFLDSESPGAPGFFNDVEHHYLAEGASTFTFSVNKKKNGILQDYCQFLNEDAYFSFSENGEDHFYSVGTVDEDNDTTFTVTCYSLNLELRLEQCDSLENTASHNIQWYFDQMGLINNTQITIGINEVSDLSRIIKYDGQESKLARLISLIGNFDAEFEFITKSNNDGTLDKIILNIYKENDGVNFQGVGTNRDDVILTLDTNITGVSRTVDKTQIFNATTITGADGLTWNSSEFSYVNSDGVEEFYKRKNSGTAFAPLSLAKYPSQIQSSTGDRWIRKNFTTNYTSANAIWGYAVSQFKKFAYGIVTYKVSVSSLLVNSEVGNGLPLKIGDTVTISDDNFIDSNGVHGLILSARVSEMEISRTDPTKNTLVLSNYIRLQSQISNDLQSQLSNLVDAATPYRAELTTTNGTQFKNGTGSTTLSAHIFKGSATTETVADSYEWSKDGTVVAPTQTITVDASGVADKAVYSYKATVAGKVVASQSVTITNVNDGTDGKTSYTHVAWANNITGADGFTTVYPNLNLIEGTKDFSGDWINGGSWSNDGTYNGLTVKSYQGVWGGMFKKYIIPEDGLYTWSSFVKSESDTSNIFRVFFLNNNQIPIVGLGSKFDWLRDSVTVSLKKGDEVLFNYGNSENNGGKLSVAGYKLEHGSIATPYMQSASEVTTADWPSYIGQYSDFTSTASTDPTKYAPWTVFKGIDGNNGRGIVSSEQKYQLTQTSAKPVDPWDNSVWQTTQPTTTATNKYLWSITRTTFNLAPLTQDIVEQKAVYGDKGTDGDPGKVVSDTEPTTRFKGLTWKYSGTADLTASDGTVIHLNTEYYYNGTNWMINYLSANNIEANSIKADKIDAKNLTITDGEFVSTTTNGPVTTSTEIKDNHIAISKTDGTVNTRNDIALDSEQGLAQKFTNIDTGFYRTAGINYQGPFTSDSDGNYAQLTPQGTKLSTDVPWTILSPLGGFSGGLIRFAVKNGVAHFSLAGLSCPSMTAGNWIKCAQLPTGSIAIPSENQVTAAFANATVWGFYVSKSGGLYLQSTSNSPALNGLVNASNSFPIG
ncbi:phage tail protein [Lactococcus lactis]|uniref:phage tail protein n=1 Tax=Lactococcus lactis TaxID=1358 RepID=UPI003D0E99E1